MPDLGLLFEAIALTIYEIAVSLGMAVVLSAIAIALCWLFSRWVRRTSAAPGPRVRPQREQPIDLYAERKRLAAALDRRCEEVELRRAR